MQYFVNPTQPNGLPGQEASQVPCTVISRVTEDSGCRPGSVAFGGTNPELQAVSKKADAGTEDILGIVKRCPFISGSRYNDSIGVNRNIDIITHGAVMVSMARDRLLNATLGERIAVNPVTGELAPESALEPEEEL